MTGRAVVFGARGQIGRAAIAAFSAAGWAVDAVSRSGAAPRPPRLQAGVRWVDAGGQTRARVLSEIGGRADVVIDPTLYGPGDAADLLDGDDHFGAVIAVSSSSVYRDDAGRSLDEAAETGFPRFDGPIREDQPTVAPGPDTYSTRKVAMERLLFDGERPATVLRPGAVHGPGARKCREWWVIRRLLDGRDAIPLTHEGRSRFQPTSTAAIATIALAAASRPASRILNVADGDCPTAAEIVRTLAALSNRPMRVVGVPEAGAVGASPWSTTGPFVLDASSAATALGAPTPPPYAEAVKATVAWLEQLAPPARAKLTVFEDADFEAFDYAAEDPWLGR